MKTPKEKAIELVDYFEKAIRDTDMYGDYSEATKKCALILVNKMIEETRAKFWYDVKHELEKL